MARRRGEPKGMPFPLTPLSELVLKAQEVEDKRRKARETANLSVGMASSKPASPSPPMIASSSRSTELGATSKAAAKVGATKAMAKQLRGSILSPPLRAQNMLSNAMSKDRCPLYQIRSKPGSSIALPKTKVSADSDIVKNKTVPKHRPQAPPVRVPGRGDKRKALEIATTPITTSRST